VKNLLLTFFSCFHFTPFSSLFFGFEVMENDVQLVLSFNTPSNTLELAKSTRTIFTLLQLFWGLIRLVTRFFSASFPPLGSLGFP